VTGTRRKPAERPSCGSRKAYLWHLKLDEEPCGPCRVANAVYVKERRAARPDRRNRAVRGATARRRALGRLAVLHADEFASLLRDARRKAGL
jgi:hypothetical protein